MAASSVAEQIVDDDQTLDELIDQKVEEKVEQRVAEETADIREELRKEKQRNRMLERALAERDRRTQNEYAPLSSVRYGIAMIARGLTGADADVTAPPHKHEEHFSHLGDSINDLKDTVARHDSIIEEQGTASGDSKEQKWQDTIEAAENLKDKSEHQIGDGWVKLFKENIQQATGCSDRRAAQLIDEWDDEKQGTDKNEYKHIPSSRKTKNSNVQRKALKIDLDVWGDD